MLGVFIGFILLYFFQLYQNRGINAATFNGFDKILKEDLPAKRTAEMGQLDQLKDNFIGIDCLNNLYIRPHQSDIDMVDAMVTDFGMRFPDFDIFNYVDPDVADDLHMVKSDIRQPENDPNKLAAGNPFHECCNHRCQSREKSCSANNRSLAPRDEDLEWLKFEVKRLQNVVLELQEQLNKLTVIYRPNFVNVCSKMWILDFIV